MDFFLKFLLTSLQTAFIGLHYPQYVVKTVSKPTKSHSHPVSAVDRLLAEDIAISYIRSRRPDGWILDVGGNPARHLSLASEHNRTSIHSCNPILGAQDCFRYESRRECVDTCEHTYSECDCVQPVACLMVHSLYYIGVESILDMVVRTGCAVSVHHNFDHQYGKFFTIDDVHEGEYTVAEGKVVCSFLGNAVYEHDNPTWLKQCYYSNGRDAMAWSTLYINPNTSIVVFTRAPLGLEPQLNDRTPYLETMRDVRPHGHGGPEQPDEPIYVEYEILDYGFVFPRKSVKLLPKQWVENLMTLSVFRETRERDYSISRKFVTQLTATAIKKAYKLNLPRDYVDNSVEHAIVTALQLSERRVAQVSGFLVSPHRRWVSFWRIIFGFIVMLVALLASGHEDLFMITTLVSLALATLYIADRKSVV